ncbi:MAG: hypothetical protein NTW21_11675 [Verrucomicrobia bacterium]|nr:hypothetical protein [Verrucomicrobiota bacterium]
MIRFQPLLLLASIDVVRPVFLIVMGGLLLVFGWRIATGVSAWSGRCIVAGGLLLCFGYAVLLPLYETGFIMGVTSLSDAPGASPAAFGWHAVKLVVMNGGWLLLGIGMALHAKRRSSPAPGTAAKPQPGAVHEFIA